MLTLVCSFSDLSHIWFLLNYTIVLQSKSFDPKIVSPASAESHGISSALPSLRGQSSGLDQSASSTFNLPTRSFATEGPTSENVSAPSDVPRRIKFKRLDKTARHIMQALIFCFLFLHDILEAFSMKFEGFVFFIQTVDY